jgi:succinoglycan biosynthesis transport protein ExoP
MNLHQFFNALRGRFWVFATLAASVVVAAILVTLFLPRTYESTVSLLLDYRDEQSLAGTMPSMRERAGFMQTQMDIIMSQRVAQRVVQDLGMAANPQTQAAFAASGSKGTIEEWLAGGLLTKLKVSSSQSSVIQLTYSAGDPEFATQVANAFGKAYMGTALDLRVNPTKQATGWFEEQLKTLRKDLEEAQAKLAAFQKEKGIIVTDERLDVENARLAELTTQALQAQNVTYESQSRSGLANGSKARDNLPEVLGNPVVQAIKAELMRAEAALSETATRLGPNHPQYQQQASQVATLRGRMGAEMNRIVQGVQNVTAQSQAREKSLQAALAAQRQKVIEMRDAKNEAFILAKDVETAQKAYETAQARYTVNKVESGARQANVTVLNEATVPSRPAKPKALLNVILGAIVGVMLGLAAVFMLELLDRRVRSTDDLEAGLDAPVIGNLQTWHPSRLLGGNGGNTRALPSPA